MAAEPDSPPLASSDEIQGNILAPFRCDHQAFVFLGFGHNRNGARQWLGDVAERVTSTRDARSGPGVPFRNLGLTATGLVALHPELASDLVQFEAFWNGPLGSRIDDSGDLTTTAALLSDVDASDPTSWVVGGPDRPPIDAVLTIATERSDPLRAEIDEETRKAEAAGLNVVRVEKGQVLRKEKQSIDHFGFADGISQPGIRGYSRVADAAGRPEDADRPGSPIIAAGEFILGYRGERRPPAHRPRPSPAPWMRDGSFQVFRRLRQDVTGWRQRTEALSGYGSAPDEVQARAIGRRADGRPLDPSYGSETLNAFTYENDPHGWYTPFYAHIRKMNPRDDTVFRDRSHKLLRRGVSFGPSIDEGAPEDERGLLFNAYMASIEDQFEFLQRRWANDPEFPASTLARFQPTRGKGRTVSGLDPVLGDDAQVARRRFGKRIARDIPLPALGGFVTTTGSVYAFAPAIGALKLLARENEM